MQSGQETALAIVALAVQAIVSAVVSVALSGVLRWMRRVDKRLAALEARMNTRRRRL